MNIDIGMNVNTGMKKYKYEYRYRYKDKDRHCYRYVYAIYTFIKKACGHPIKDGYKPFLFAPRELASLNLSKGHDEAKETTQVNE